MLKNRPTTLHLLLRRSTTEIIKSLYEKGEIYINTIDDIRKYDNNPERSDPYDSMGYRLTYDDIALNNHNFSIKLNNKLAFNDEKNRAVYYDSQVKGNIYCFEGVYQEDFEQANCNIIHNTHSLGEAIIVIRNPKEFISRVTNGLKALNHKFSFNTVDYYSYNYSGILTPFWKLEKFRNQKEFRFYIPNKANKLIRFEIGSIADISDVFYTETMFKLKFTNGEIKYINASKVTTSI